MVDTSPPPPSEKVVQRLTQLGLDWDVLWWAIAEGEWERQTATKFAPAPAGGLKDWITRVGTLRKQLDDQDWTPVDDHHIPLSVNTSNTIGVGVLLGDNYTGWCRDTDWNRERGPRSKYPKGPTVLQVGDHNETIPGLEMPPEHVPREALARMHKWSLVTYRRSYPIDPNKPGGRREVEVRSELSLPGPSTSGTHIDTWLDWIILPRTQLALPVEPVGDDDGDDMDGLFDGM